MFAVEEIVKDVRFGLHLRHVVYQYGYKKLKYTREPKTQTIALFNVYCLPFENEGAHEDLCKLAKMSVPNYTVVFTFHLFHSLTLRGATREDKNEDQYISNI